MGGMCRRRGEKRGGHGGTGGRRGEGSMEDEKAQKKEKRKAKAQKKRKLKHKEGRARQGQSQTFSSITRLILPEPSQILIFKPGDVGVVGGVVLLFDPFCHFCGGAYAAAETRGEARS